MDECCHIHPVSVESDQPEKTKSKRPSYIKEVIALLLAVLSFLASMPGLIGFSRSPVSVGLSFACSFVVAVVFGYRFWLAIPKIFKGANMNTLVGLGIVAAYALSFWQWSLGHLDQIFFDSAAFVATFVMLGQWVEKLAHHKIQSQLPSLIKTLPAKAHLLDEVGQMKEVELSSLKAGDKIRVLPGERVPVDAVLLSSEGSFDESVVTGESKMISRNAGDHLLQASLNVGQPIEVEVKNASGSSYFENLVKYVQKTLSERPPFQKKVDRWASILIPAVILISVLSALYWYYFAHNTEMMISSGVAVLVIACPCALGIATPISLLVAIIRASRSGVLIKNLDAIEKARELTMIAFDKTGTLTIGKPEITHMLSIENISHQDLLQWAASLESQSEHPYARAVLKKAKEDQVKLLEVKEVYVEAGKGLRGRVVKDSKEHQVCLGNLIWLFENGIEATTIPDKLRWEADGTEDTALWLAVDSKVVGMLFLGDQIRPEADEVVQSLTKEGFEVGLITGDTENVAMKVSKALNLKFYHFGVLPKEKATLVRRLSEKQKKGIDVIYPKVAFVGDGINDGPALAEAHLGIAMGSGTSFAQSTADIVLVSNKLTTVSKTFKILDEANALLRQNLGLAVLYNVVAIPIAAGILYPYLHFVLEPSIAAFAMSLSSISVLLNSVRALGR